jgi:hypothetical protein
MLAAAAPPATATVPIEPIAFGATTCAPGWAPPQPGPNRFSVHNASPRTATVYLFDSRSGTIAATIHHLPAGATRLLRVRLVGGRDYAWSCDLKGYPIHDSEANPVPVHRQAGGSGPVVVPVQVRQLLGPLARFRDDVAGQIASLAPQVAAMQTAIADGDLAGARADWLTAHQTWLSIGEDDGAYGAFGALGQAIDGTAAGRVGGTANPRFTGFHRVELDLWGPDGLATAGPDAATLDRYVQLLQAGDLSELMPGSTEGVNAWVLRPHEILEDALRDTLSGDDEYGSGTALASVLADVDATRETLELLAPLITPRAPRLVGDAHRELTRLTDAIDAAHGADGGWLAIARLPRAQREQIDAACGAALETLARVPDLLRTGTT